MRIIAGDLRGRQISAPEGLRTRPMLDRVRQAVFNIVGAAYGDPGSVPPVAVLDVFAGSGALGIEALSRGAAWCCFVEEDVAAVRTLQGNLKALDLEGRAQVVRGSAMKVKVPRPPVGDQGTGDRGQGPADKPPMAPSEHAPATAQEHGTRAPSAGGRYSLVFLDPPYPLSRDSSVRAPVGQLLTQLPQIAPLDPSVLVVLRHEADAHYDDNVYGRFEAIDVRRYGGMAVTFMEMV
jgi:16S rRNA G966 N2-methylase RsmD